MPLYRVSSCWVSLYWLSWRRWNLRLPVSAENRKIDRLVDSKSSVSRHNSVFSSQWYISIVNIIIAHADWLTEWGTLRVRARIMLARVQAGNAKGGKYHCTIDLLFDRFGLVCFANKNKNRQLSYSWFQTSQTGGQWYSDTSPFSITWFRRAGVLYAWKGAHTIDI